MGRTTGGVKRALSLAFAFAVIALGAACSDYAEEKPVTTPNDAGGSSASSSGVSPDTPDLDAGQDVRSADTGSLDLACVVTDFSANEATPFPCSPSAQTGQLSGTFVAGRYQMKHFWTASASCGDETLHIAAADIFTQNGAWYMRYKIVAKKDSTSVGTTVSGTWLLEPDPDGNVIRTEQCDPDRKGTHDIVQYLQQQGALPNVFFDLGTTRQEGWFITESD